MNDVAAALFVTLAIANGTALAQGAEDPVARLRACSLMERDARYECLDRLSRAVAPLQPQEPQADNWIVSETTSPVDYSPIATATTSAREGPSESATKLWIRCRGARTELVLVGPSISSRGNEYALSYHVDGGQPVQIAGIVPSFGSGVAVAGDIGRLLQSLPEGKTLTVRLSARTGSTRDETFSLTGLDTVRAIMARTCKWPHVIARPVQ